MPRRRRQAICRWIDGSPSSFSGDDLPDDCWESILARLDDLYEHGPVSLVCKRFLAITNKLRTEFALSSYVRRHAPPSGLATRFPNLHTFRLCFDHPNIGRFLRRLADSGVPLRTLSLYRLTRFPRAAMRRLGSSRLRNTLKAFTVVVGTLTDGDLFVIAKCFSYIQHLELERCGEGYGVDVPYLDGSLTDEGIRAIAMSLTSMLSFQFNCLSNISHRSFEYLSANCRLLSDVRVEGLPCGFQCFHSFASLTSLELNDMIIAEDVHGLEVLAGANLKLKKLSLSFPAFRLVNFVAMFRFLKYCRSLNELRLSLFLFSYTSMALDFAASIPNMQVIGLFRCRGLPRRLLFNLLRNCPHLEEIDFTDTVIGTLKESSNSGIRHGLRKLSLGPYVGFNDKTLENISTICPNLESVHLIHHKEITEKGVSAFMTNCPNIKNLSSIGGGNRFTFYK